MAHENHSQGFIIGAALGSVLGGVAALLLAPKSGKKICRDICDYYSNVSEKACDLVRNGKSVIKEGKCKVCDWGSTSGNKAHSLVNCLSSWLKNKEECPEECSTKNVFIGGLVGSAIGATAGFFLAPTSGERLRKDISDRYEEVSDAAERYYKKGKSFAKQAQSKADGWLDFAKELIDEYTEEGGDTSQLWADKAKKVLRDDRAKKILDWASLGYRVWNKLQSRR